MREVRITAKITANWPYRP